MSDPTFVHSSIIDWLLEEDNPSVRYLTLREILDFPQDDPQMLQARSDIMQSNPVLRADAGDYRTRRSAQ